MFANWFKFAHEVYDHTSRALDLEERAWAALCGRRASVPPQSESVARHLGAYASSVPNRPAEALGQPAWPVWRPPRPNVV